MTDVKPDVSTTTSLGARILLAPIVAYRRWLSPVLPPRCRFYPSCSEYAVTAITTHGPVRGLGLATWRLFTGPTPYDSRVGSHLARSTWRSLGRASVAVSG